MSLGEHLFYIFAKILIYSGIFFAILYYLLDMTVKHGIGASLILGIFLGILNSILGAVDK